MYLQLAVIFREIRSFLHTNQDSGSYFLSLHEVPEKEPLLLHDPVSARATVQKQASSAKR